MPQEHDKALAALKRAGLSVQEASLLRSRELARLPNKKKKRIKMIRELAGQRQIQIVLPRDRVDEVQGMIEEAGGFIDD